MELIHDLLVLLHLVGFAALFGGAFVQVKGPSRAVNAAMVHGVLTQLITGLLLVGLADEELQRIEPRPDAWGQDGGMPQEERLAPQIGQ